MPKIYPEEFKRDVVAIARKGELTREDIAHDFDISTSTIKRWVAQADIDDGVADGVTTSEHNELVEMRRRNRRLQQEVEILRRATAYFAKDAAPK